MHATPAADASAAVALGRSLADPPWRRHTTESGCDAAPGVGGQRRQQPRQALPRIFGAWGVAVAEDAEDASALPGYDQRSQAAEAFAAIQALRAAVLAQEEVVLIIDNRSVCLAVCSILSHSPPPTTRPSCWRYVAWLLAQARVTDCFWVPSHGKRPDWAPLPPHALSGEAWRALNRRADVAAGEAGLAAWRDRQQERASCKAAERWTRHALLLRHRSTESYLALHEET
jgi:ribonuclease HI